MQWKKNGNEKDGKMDFWESPVTHGQLHGQHATSRMAGPRLTVSHGQLHRMHLTGIVTHGQPYGQP